ncbi:YuzF family protein [Paenibacillus tarimensis]|uniref:YuzF family protein n=1 Tax=Paenibacillus tarimensis TaxID=416012 RepID=UPI001F34DBAF|nr:YuzF family protein [Paenibacillus tarimensis]MCF2944296.1 YuzF family protein [Paenibacillus tarimensis]
MHTPSITLSDPYLYESLQPLSGKWVALDTPCGSLRGVLKSVMPDHIIVQVGEMPFYVRIQQLIWIYPC